MRNASLRWVALALAAMVPLSLAAAADSHPPAKETVVLQRAAVPGTDRELGMGIAEFPPNSAKPRQKATGPEVCYVLAGEVTVTIAGQAGRLYRTGESFRLPAGVVHQTVAGPTGAKVLAAWVHTPGERFNIAVPR